MFKKLADINQSLIDVLNQKRDAIESMEKAYDCFLLGTL